MGRRAAAAERTGRLCTPRRRAGARSTARCATTTARSASAGRRSPARMEARRISWPPSPTISSSGITPHHPRLRPPAERGGAAADRAALGGELPGGACITGCSWVMTARSSRSGTTTRRSPSSATKAFLPRRCALTSTSSGCRSTTSTWICPSAAPLDRRDRGDAGRGARRCRRGAGRARAAPCAAPARSSRRGRSPRQILEPDARRARRRRPGRRWSGSPSCARPGRRCSTRTEARAIVRELKAVGGEPEDAAARVDRSPKGPELWTVVAALAARRGAPARGRGYNTAMTVRLYDTSTRVARRPAGPPAPSGCTSAARPSTSARTSATRCPFVVFPWLRNWLRERGYDVTYVHNITDINDKIYEAAPGRSAERAAEATQWYLEDTASFGLGLPDVAAARDRDDPRDRRA